MPIDFAPPQVSAQPFQIQPVQYTDPLQTLAQMGQLRNQALQGQLTSQELQQKQMEMNSQRAMMQTISGVAKDPTVKPEDYDQEIMKRLQANPAVLPTHAMTISNDLIKRRQDLQGLEKSDRELLAQDTDQVAQAYNTVKDQASQDPANAQSYLDQANATLQKKNAFRSGHIDPLQTYDAAHMDTYLGLLQGQQAHNKQLQEKATLAETQAKATQASATADQEAALTEKTKLETKQVQKQLDWATDLIKTPQGLQDYVNKQIDPSKGPLYADYNRRAVAAATGAAMRGDAKGVTEAVNEYAKLISEGEKTVSTETDPRVLNARTQQAVQTEVATSPLKVAQQVASAKALRQGDNPEVAGVAPAAILGVQNQAMKLDEQYAKEKAATESLGKVLDLAQSGNKAAGTNLPLLGVETLNAINGIKRVNSAEIHQYEQAGSLWDNIVGRIGKLTVGKPIPKDVLNDIRTLHQVLGQQSYQNYTDSLNAINARTGARLTPKIAAPNLNRGGVPPVPNTIPAQFRNTAHWSPSQQKFYYSTDGGKTWVPAPLQ